LLTLNVALLGGLTVGLLLQWSLIPLLLGSGRRWKLRR